MDAKDLGDRQSVTALHDRLDDTGSGVGPRRATAISTTCSELAVPGGGMASRARRETTFPGSPPANGKLLSGSRQPHLDTVEQHVVPCSNSA